LVREPSFFDDNAGGIHWTVHHNKPRHLKQLLDLGHPLEQEDEDGQTALNVAAKNGYIVCTEMLLDAGANLEARDSCDMTPIAVAAMYG
jgi:ankyrin repeat protein